MTSGVTEPLAGIGEDGSEQSFATVDDIIDKFRKLTRAAMTETQQAALVEAVLDRIGPHAVGDLGELRQILRDLFRRDLRGRDQGCLRAPERGVGNALQLCVGINRRARKRNRRGQPPPKGRDHT